jgi:hypothetical protein
LSSRIIKLLTVTALVLGIAGTGYVVAREPGSPTAVRAAVDQYVPNLPEPGGPGGVGSAAGGGGVAGGALAVSGVPLARTGFDAWIFALLGGLILTGGIVLLAAQRR